MARPTRSLFVLAGLLLLLGVCVGCGPGNPLGREAISGRITMDGKPLEWGNIRFEPIDGKKDAVGSGDVITDGHYSIAAEKGLPPGKYRVRIFAGTARAPGEKLPGEEELPMPGVELPGKELIPRKYNSASQITHGIKAAASE